MLNDKMQMITEIILAILLVASLGLCISSQINGALPSWRSLYIIYAFAAISRIQYVIERWWN